MVDKNKGAHGAETTIKSITGGPIERGVYKAAFVMGVISAIGMAAMMLVTMYDVFMRYLFANPLYGVYELVGIFLVVTSSFGMALCQKDKSHITITLLTDKLPPGMKKITVVFGLLMSFICYGIITWQMALDTGLYFTRGSGGLTPELGFNWGYVSAFFTIGGFVFSVVLLMQLIQSFRRKAKG